METIVDWSELVVELSAVPSAVLPSISLFSFIPLLFFFAFFFLAVTSHWVCVTIIAETELPYYFFLGGGAKSNLQPVKNYNVGTLSEPLKCLD